MSFPRISLITPSYQQAAYLEECIASVHSANSGAEHIVVDGGSTDGSKAILEKHANAFAWWCNEKDAGQSDAINKGLSHATGEVFSWLNSDDALLPGALDRVRATFAQDPQLIVFGGKVTHVSAAGTRPFDGLNDAHDRDRLFIEPVINQPATFWRMETVRSIGGVDPKLRYVMDLELWWQVLFRFGTAHLRFEPIALAAFRLHNESKTSTAILGFLDEIAALLHGLCLRTGNNDLGSVLAAGHPMKSDLRGIPANPEHKALVRRMTLHFLFKWNAEIHRENQFDMMHALAALQLGANELTTEQHHRWSNILPDLRGSWNMFRLRRKMKHWGL